MKAGEVRGTPVKIGIVNASSRFSPERGEAVEAWFAANIPGGEVKIVFHPATYGKHGHFGGDDASRANAFVEFANDPRLDAIWFARGGYGACRVADAILPRLNATARKKRYLGYSDAGSLLAMLYKAGFPHVAHGPMASDAVRHDETAWRAINWLKSGDAASLEPSLRDDPRPAVAFNLAILDALMGTHLEPDLTGHVVMIEEVSEPLYRFDRMMFHLTAQPGMKRIAGLRLGRVSEIVENDPDFGQTPEEIVRNWCARSGIPYLGAADIGHDRDNKVVPFGPR
ncbi:LD-carboxypeptidase [Brevundimonas sp. NPDC092305]|uniref:LD-carboxypeptidase n=1 Tax=Brevundimonas sp. NPDC092305 TaxID=3363957 RepID=UPI0038143689